MAADVKTVREEIEAREQVNLAHGACLSSSARRDFPEVPCTVRTAFQHDRDRILHCKAFRRLKYKTQVFLSPEGDHYRTRLTHTLEVAQIARTVARALALNEDLTEAIALGHDLGHTPFGHAGERVLNEMVPVGFRHAQQSVRVVEMLEKDGAGLNLTAEVRDGIARHSKSKGPLTARSEQSCAATLEGRIVRLADVVAYVNHDLDDALRAGLITLADIPAGIIKLLGPRHSCRIDAMVRDMISASRAAEDDICLSAPMAETISALRGWLFEHVYQAASVDADFEKASRVLRELFCYFVSNESVLMEHGGVHRANDSLETSVADVVAGMTDRYAMNLYQKLFFPQPWKVL